MLPIRRRIEPKPGISRYELYAYAPTSTSLVFRSQATQHTAPSRNTFSLKHIFRVTSFEQRNPAATYLVRGPSGGTINLKNKTEKRKNHDTSTTYSLSLAVSRLLAHFKPQRRNRLQLQAAAW